MATAKPILYKHYKSKDDTYPIIIRLINGKKQKLHPTGEKILETSWSEKGERVKETHPEADRINAVIDAEVAKAKKYFAECKINGLAIDLELVYKDIKSHSFTGFLKKKAIQYGEKDQYATLKKIDRLVYELEKCFGKEVYFSDLTPDSLHKFDTYLKAAGNVANTRWKKFKTLSRFFAFGISEGLTAIKNPFPSYKISTTPVKKDKLSFEEIKKMEELDLKPGAIRLARDLFLFSYYCKGIRFQTVITMQKSAIRGDRLHFLGNKGNKPISAVIHPKIKAIIDRYGDTKGEYLFPVVKVPFAELSASQKRMKEVVGSCNVTVNKNLKIVAGIIGTDINVSFHISRHTFAWHLKQKEVSVHVIKDALAHGDTATTERYLKSLDDQFLDKELSKLYE